MGAASTKNQVSGVIFGSATDGFGGVAGFWVDRRLK